MEAEKSGKVGVKGQSYEEGKKKVVSKTIHLVSSNNNTSIDKLHK